MTEQRDDAQHDRSADRPQQHPAGCRSRLIASPAAQLTGHQRLSGGFDAVVGEGEKRPHPDSDLVGGELDRAHPAGHRHGHQKDRPKGHRAHDQRGAHPQLDGDAPQMWGEPHLVALGLGAHQGDVNEGPAPLGDHRRQRRGADAKVEHDDEDDLDHQVDQGGHQPDVQRCAGVVVTPTKPGARHDDQQRRKSGGGDAQIRHGAVDHLGLGTEEPGERRCQGQHHQRHRHAEQGAEPGGGHPLLGRIPLAPGAEKSGNRSGGGEREEDEDGVGGHHDRAGHRQAGQRFGPERADQGGVGQQVGGLGGQRGGCGHRQSNDLTIPAALADHHRSGWVGLPTVTADTSRSAAGRPRRAQRWPD